MHQQNTSVNIKSYSKNLDNNKQKQIWFFSKNEQFQENHFFNSDLVKKLLDYEWSNNVLNLHNIKRSLLLIYKEFEYEYYKMEDYERVKQETNQISNEAIKVLIKILKNKGIRMLAYDSTVPEIYNQIAQISEMFLCILYQAKILECYKLCIFQSSNSTQIDQLMQNEIEQSFLQQQFIKIFQENGIVPTHITFYCIEKIKLENAVQYFLYFDVVEQQIANLFLQKSLSFGRRLFDCYHKQQETIIQKIINFAIFDQQVFFSLAQRQSPEGQNEQIVYKIAGIWPDNIDEVMSAKINELFLDYGNQSSEDLKNNFSIQISKDTKNLKEQDYIEIDTKEYKYSVKLQVSQNTQFRYYSQNLCQNQLDFRCLQPSTIQIILEQLFNPSYFEVPSNQSGSFISSQQSYFKEFLDQFQQSSNRQNPTQVINENRSFFQINNDILQCVLYIVKLFGLQDLESININKKKQNNEITKEELDEYYTNKKYEFIDFNNCRLKYCLSIFYETFSDLPVITDQELSNKLQQQQEIDKKNFIENQSLQKSKKKKFHKDRRIKQIELIKNVCLSSSKELYFLQEYNEIENVLKQNQKYQNLQQDEFKLIQNIFIHIFSIQKCKNLIWCKKITLQGFNGQKPDQGQVSERTMQFFLSQTNDVQYQNLDHQIQIFKYKFNAENDSCYIYFDIKSKQLVKHINSMIQKNQIQTNISLLGIKTIIPIRYLKQQKNEIINQIKPEDQTRFSITYYTNPVFYYVKDKKKQVYCQIIGERHGNKLLNQKSEIKNDQCITFMEEHSHLQGDTSYLRDLIEHLNRKHYDQGRSQSKNPQFARSILYSPEQNNHISEFQLLHTQEIQGQIKLLKYYIKPIIKDLTSSYKFYEFNSQDIYDPDWWLTGWPLLYRSVFDMGDDQGYFIFSDDPNYILQQRQKEKKSNEEIENPFYFYVCSIDPRFDNFQLIESNHYAKIPSYYCRIRCIIFSQRQNSCSIF
ncbi:hypothetical protein TTHERM_00842370 (macronuclear) [Tetrahymena thermophila SB210]|uniref:Uncharacterized protein n=1 Tax=Tetrahymena thermophila (strain SB210) TaxID=312017 RepID=I7MMV0_TETTS|nr:hypothetical protein TTHERM_00842370 [Tetrahymena thermophila SB210]EAS07011.2 hypothetical protein TTHERM_00842370 [Tetrahymena thermophila SB210]|eukprot:XP_001027253.2 hypothetical protein TTHERM_00842370 [Tetrahymena thermophila SB210]